MKKKQYMAPATGVWTVRVENMLAASMPVDHQPGDGLEGNSASGWDIWAE